MITDDDIRRVVSRNAFDAGLQYQIDGRVEALDTGNGGATIKALVQGSGRLAYRQTVYLAQTNKGAFRIAGTCTCPIGFNCKHVAAVLFEYQVQTGFGADSKDLFAGAAPPQDRTAQAINVPAPQAAELPLPADIDAWLRSLDAAQDEENEDYPPTVRKRLLYVLECNAQSGGVTVSLQSIELKRDGSPSHHAKRHTSYQLLNPAQPPKFIRPSDRGILRRLNAFGADTEDFIDALRSIIATGRGRWHAPNGTTLTEGPPVQGELVWTVAENGQQRPDLHLAPPLIPLRLAAPWYVDPATGAMGPIETGLPHRLVRAILASPAVGAAAATRVREEMSRRWPTRNLPAPKPLAPPTLLREELTPHLLLFGEEVPFDPAQIVVGGRGRQPARTSYAVALARLSWQYGPIRLRSGVHIPRDQIVQHEGALFQIARDEKAEQQASLRLKGLNFGRIDNYHGLPYGHANAADLMLMDPDQGAWIDVMLTEVPKLRAEGWQVEVAPSFPLQLAEASGDVSVEIQESSGIDWFDLGLGVMVDGARVNLVPALLDFMGKSGLAMMTGQSDDAALPLLLPLPDGRLLAIPLAKVQPILGPLLELFTGGEMDAESGTLRLHRGNAGDLALLEAASADGGILWSGGESVRALGRQLREHGGMPRCAVPDGFVATLRPYQEHGLAWLQFLGSAGLGGVLADDMGLGKTVQALAHIAVEQQQGRLQQPALVICPTSLVPNWRTEAARFAPKLRVLVLHGPDRAAQFPAIGAHDLVITTYPLLARDHAVLTAQDWHIVMLDEAQTIKNPLATTSKLARTLRAGQRLCLSGTPLENHLGELWSLFDFLAPGFLGDRQQFGRRFRTPIEKAGNTERQTLLAQRIAPFLLRRTKGEVAADLPPKTEIAEVVEMEEGQRAIYEGIRLVMHAKVRAAIAKRGLAGSGIVILDALLKLRQACCDPRLLKLTTAKAARAKSAKLDRLMELLPQMIEEGRRVLLFSQFTSMLALIQAELDQLGIPYVLLTGDTRDRAGPVGRFQAGEVPLFLISLKAGGTGLNLTAADTVIHYDPWWNPAVEDQATDRAHRIGQDKPVFVHRLITAGSIEEKMETLKQRKQALAAGILGASTGPALALTEGDLDMLFAPLG